MRYDIINSRIFRSLLILIFTISQFSVFAQFDFQILREGPGTSDDFLIGAAVKDNYLFYVTVNTENTGDDSVFYILERLDLNTRERKTIPIKTSPDEPTYFNYQGMAYHEGYYYFHLSLEDPNDTTFRTNHNNKRNALAKVDWQFENFEYIDLNFPSDSLLILDYKPAFRDGYLYLNVSPRLYPMVHNEYIYKYDLRNGEVVDTLRLPDTRSGSDNTRCLAWLDDDHLINFGVSISIIDVRNHMNIVQNNPKTHIPNTNLHNSQTDLIYSTFDSVGYHFAMDQDEHYLYKTPLHGAYYCADTLFTRDFSAFRYTRYFSNSHDLIYPDFNYLMGYDATPSYDGIILFSFMSDGTLRWTKSISLKDQYVRYGTVRALPDSGVVGVVNIDEGKGTSPGIGIDYIFRLDKNGNNVNTKSDAPTTDRTITTEDILILYPSPDQNFISVANANLVEKAKEIRIYDIAGRITMHVPFAQKINISGLSAGMYIYQLEDTDGKLYEAKWTKF